MSAPGRRARQVLALAGAAFREAVRMKAFAGGAVFAATAAAMSPFLPSDGTPAGAVRLAISVSLLTATAFGTFAAVMLASLLPAREYRDSTGFLLATKPVPRWGLFAGRALGISAVLAVMFAGMAILSWIFVRYTAARESRRGEAAAIEVAEALAVRSGVGPAWETGPERRARVGPGGPLSIPPGGRHRWAFDLHTGYSRVRPMKGRIYLGAEAAGAPSDAQGSLAVRALNPGTGEWSEVAVLGPPPLAGRVAPGSSGEVARRGGAFLRMLVPAEAVGFSPDDPRLPGAVGVEIENTSAGPIALGGPHPVTLLAGSQVGVAPGGTYRWEFLLRPGAARPAFRLQAYRSGFQAQEVQIEFRGEGEPAVVTRGAELDARGRATLRLPSGMIGESGRVSAVMRNVSESGVRVVEGEGLIFAPRAGTFAGALVRWAALEIAKATLIVIVVCAGATVLSFPIPALLGGVVAAGGYLVSFVIALTMSGVDSVWALVFEGALRIVLPDLTGASAAGLVAGGAFVPTGFIMWSVLLLIFVRGGIIALVGAYLAGRREVGA